SMRSEIRDYLRPLSGGHDRHARTSRRRPALRMIMRKPKAVWTSEDVALILIDFQKEMFDTVRSETHAAEIELNVRFLIRIAKALNIPIVLSTVGVAIGVNGPTRQAILDELPGAKVIDRTSMDAWEDKAFRVAVQKT